MRWFFNISVSSSCEIGIVHPPFPSPHPFLKKVVSVVWQDWQVWGIITQTWKVCVSTFGHLRRIDPHRTAVGLMSSDRPASNEKRATAAFLHQPSATSVQHPIMPPTCGARKPGSGRSPVSHTQTRDTELAVRRVWTQETAPTLCSRSDEPSTSRFFPAGQTCLGLSAKIVPLFLPLSFFWFPSQRVCEFLATHTLHSPPWFQFWLLDSSACADAGLVQIYSYVRETGLQTPCCISLEIKSAISSFARRERLNLLKPVWTAFSGQIGFGLRNNWCLCWRSRSGISATRSLSPCCHHR